MKHPLPPPQTQATGVGALPHTNPYSAWKAALSLFPRFPFVPTLPNRSWNEQIVYSDSTHLPGRTVVKGRLYADTTKDLLPAMETIYLDFLEGRVEPYGADEEHASAFHVMMQNPPVACDVLKCQVTGPVTFGMQVTDCTKRPLFYDAQFADLLGKLLGLRARWFEREMRNHVSGETLVVFNEPYLASLGSSVVPLNRESVEQALQDAVTLLEGAWGIHCCANTDWGFILSLQPSVLSFDAYQLAKEFLLYSEDIARYLEQGGVIAWGIVPSDPRAYSTESVATLFDRYAGIRSRLLELVPAERLDAQSLITPTCGILFGTEQEAEKILQGTAMLAEQIRSAFL